MKFIASCSFGKDSIATILLAREHNEPLDEIVYCEVMFDTDISGELPEHRDFIYNKAIPIFESWGYKATVLKSEKNYTDCFHHKTIRGKRVGMKKGFVMSGHCDVQRDCKLKPIKEYWKSQSKEVVQYIGVAIDEPKRLDRIADIENKVSLLEKYGYTEEMAKQKCLEYGLLSPIYEFTSRGGCWFCPNTRDCELRHLRNNHRDLWDKLLELENTPNLIGNKWNTLTQTSIHDKEEQFMWEDRQIKFDFIKEENQMEKSNIKTTTETPFNQDNSPHISGSSHRLTLGVLDTKRISFCDLTVERKKKHCEIIKQKGDPGTDGNGKCMGFGRSEEDDEPCQPCKRCKHCTSYEEEVGNE